MVSDVELLIPEVVCEEESDIDETEGVWLGVPLKDSMLPVPVADIVGLFIEYGAELKPKLLNTEDDAPLEMLCPEDPAVKGPTLLVVEGSTELDSVIEELVVGYGAEEFPNIEYDTPLETLEGNVPVLKGPVLGVVGG